MNLLQQIKQSKLYPLYFLVQFPFQLPRLIAAEGLAGSLRWTWLRFNMLFARFLDRRPDFYEQPMPEFRSRLGFSLIRRAELLVYEEIFLERCYAFSGFEALLRQRPLHVLDFGTHHGLFIDYVRCANREAEVYGAEMSPGSFAVAQQRFAGQPQIHLCQVAIGGAPRQIQVADGALSVEQSIYAEQKGNAGFTVAVVTPLDFIRMWNLSANQISLIKMDIEGAEREVFANPASFKALLDLTPAFVIEIHADADIEPITRACAASGLLLAERRGINFFFQRR